MITMLLSGTYPMNHRTGVGNWCGDGISMGIVESTMTMLTECIDGGCRSLSMYNNPMIIDVAAKGRLEMEPTVEAKLTRFAEMVYDLGKQSHNTAQEFPKAIDLFIDIYRNHKYVHPDDIKHFFEGRGWTEDDAQDIGTVADVVEHTMRHLGIISPP